MPIFVTLVCVTKNVPLSQIMYPPEKSYKIIPLVVIHINSFAFFFAKPKMRTTSCQNVINKLELLGLLVCGVGDELVFAPISVFVRSHLSIMPPKSLEVDPEALSEAIKPHLEALELEYRDTIQGQLNEPGLFRYFKLLQAIRKICQHVNQHQLERVLLGICTEKEPEWHLGQEAPHFSRLNAKKIRAMLHDVSTSIQKAKAKGSSGPLWLQGFLDDTTAAEVPETPAAVWQFGFDEELELAFRFQDDVKSFGKEFCTAVEPPESGALTDSMVAVWSDGVKWPIPGLTLEDRKAVQAPSVSSGCIQGGDYEGKLPDGSAMFLVKTSASKDKSWSIIWKSVKEGKKTKRKQLFQIILTGLSDTEKQED